MINEKCLTCTAEILDCKIKCSGGFLSYDEMYKRCCQYAISKGKPCSNPMIAEHYRQMIKVS
jgi:hypothetical protein